MPALGYYLPTNSSNPEMGINYLDMVLTLVRCDINRNFDSFCWLAHEYI